MSEKNIAKAAGAVSIGSLIVQVGGVLGQLLYAFWLDPGDFGLWATASASVALVGSFLNAGEANAYLAGRALGVKGAFKRSGTFNYFLAALGSLIAIIYAVFFDMKIAILIVILVVGLPLQGRSSMLIASFIKTRSQAKLITFQAIATIVRLLVGVLVASIWMSAIALALAYVSYSVALAILGHLWIKRTAPYLLSLTSESAGSRSLRFDRAIHQFSQTLPNQIGYLTTSIFASAQLLGLYFFAYQATSAISGVLASPLSKATMSELSHVDKSQRIPVAWRFLVLVVASVSLLSSCISLMVQPLSGIVGEDWRPVLAPLVIMLASLPARFVLPITEALYMVNAKWRRSIWINLSDAGGIVLSTIIALVVLDGDVVVLAVAITLWKVIFGNTRAFFALPGRRILTAAVIILPNTLFVLVSSVSVIKLGYFHWLAFFVILLTSGIQLVVVYLSLRRSGEQKKSLAKL